MTVRPDTGQSRPGFENNSPRFGLGSARVLTQDMREQYLGTIGMNLLPIGIRHMLRATETCAYQSARLVRPEL